LINTKEITFRDYSCMIRRHKLMLLVPALSCLVLGLAIAEKLPKRFISRSVIAVEPQKLPGSSDYTSPAELNHRIAILQEQIYSRRFLEEIAARVVIIKGRGEKLDKYEEIDQLQRSIKITPLKGEFSSREEGLPVFSINVAFKDPALAQRLCEEITSMAIAGNFREREAKAQNTTTFIDQQLADDRRTLQEKSRALVDFKSRNSGMLPADEQNNLSMIGTLTAEEEAAATALAHAEQEKTYAEAMLTQKLASWRASLTGSSTDSLQQQLVKLQAELVIVEARHTDKHPDAVRLRADIAALTAQLQRATKREKSIDVPQQMRAIEPVEIQHLRAQVDALNQTVVAKQQERARLQHSLGIYRTRLQLRPALDDQYKVLTREYENALALYNDLTTKKAQAEMSVNLARQPQQDFRVIDEANYPETPESPRIALFAAGGLLFGFIIGFATVFTVEALDQALRSEEDVTTYLQLPTLASVADVNATR
jgi:protein tyrosine kinase modulator